MLAEPAQQPIRPRFRVGRDRLAGQPSADVVRQFERFLVAVLALLRDRLRADGIERRRNARVALLGNWRRLLLDEIQHSLAALVVMR